MRAEVPDRVDVRAHAAEVEALRIDVVDLAQLAAVRCSSRTCCTAGLKRNVCPTIRIRPRFERLLRRACGSPPRSSASGFSTSTCLPAASASAASSTCVAGLVAMNTASIVSSASASVSDDAVRAAGKLPLHALGQRRARDRRARRSRPAAAKQPPGQPSAPSSRSRRWRLAAPGALRERSRQAPCRGRCRSRCRCRCRWRVRCRCRSRCPFCAVMVLAVRDSSWCGRHRSRPSSPSRLGRSGPCRPRGWSCPAGIAGVVHVASVQPDAIGLCRRLRQDSCRRRSAPVVEVKAKMTGLRGRLVPNADRVLVSGRGGDRAGAVEGGQHLAVAVRVAVMFRFSA